MDFRSSWHNPIILSVRKLGPRKMKECLFKHNIGNFSTLGTLVCLPSQPYQNLRAKIFSQLHAAILGLMRSLLNGIKLLLKFVSLSVLSCLRVQSWCESTLLIEEWSERDYQSMLNK